MAGLTWQVAALRGGFRSIRATSSPIRASNLDSTVISVCGRAILNANLLTTDGGPAPCDYWQVRG